MGEQSSVRRILNAVVISIIVCAVIGMVLGAYHLRNGTLPGVIAGTLSIFIIPGLVLAFAKFIVTAVRAIRDPGERIPAVALLSVLLIPLTLPKPAELAEQATTQAMTPVAAPAAQESEQFLDGRDWAAKQFPTKVSECPGSHEFMRGCRSAILARRAEQEQEGFRWAEQHLPAKASQCQGLPHVELGCRRYYFKHLERPKPSGQSMYEGMTTAECQTEVNANYTLREKLDLEEGNFHSIAVTRNRNWEPELRDCENFDKMVENAFMPKAWDRLDKVLVRMRAGSMPSTAEKEQLLEDHARMSAIRDQPYKASYMSLHQEYSGRMGPGAR